jgi:hypothetical protein
MGGGGNAIREKIHIKGKSKRKRQMRKKKEEAINKGKLKVK